MPQLFCFSVLQLLHSPTTHHPFGPGSMPAALQLAISDKVCYWEIWNQDILNPNFETLLTDAACNVTTGIDKAEKLANTVSFYPNPANSTLYFEAQSIKNLRIFNLIGQQIYQIKIIPNQNTIDISGLENGTYFLYVEMQDASHQTSTIVIQH